ncbi:MAG: iron-sulfur cluster assembly protein [Microthrixaceae bacterium]
MDRVLAALGQVYDPEIPVDIVELGLVYRCEEHPTDDGTRRIEIDMSMTAPGCGMGDVLRVDAERAVLAVPGVDEVEVNVVWDPPWTMDRMSESARLQLGLL